MTLAADLDLAEARHAWFYELLTDQDPPTLEELLVNRSASAGVMCDGHDRAMAMACDGHVFRMVRGAARRPARASQASAA
jgi:hypothetical protein